MKKAVSFILALILVSMLLLPVGAEENASSMLVTKGALTYAIDDNFTIVACDPAVHVKDCTLPGIIDGYKVVRIGKDAFKDCTLLTDIKILEETTDIDEGAFSGCTALTKIFIPSSMVSIGEGAFSRCTNLTDVYYAGTEEQRGGITLGAGNDSFLSATWHYNYDYERPNLPDDMIGKEGLLIYGTAVDVNDAKELILTPTSEGVKVNSDNMQDARVTVNGDGTFASKAINTTKNEILVQEDEDATVGDCIKIQGTYTIRASVGLHGTISPAGYVAVDAGGTQTFTFTPDEGYTVEHVKVNGKNKGEITDYTFKKVKKDQEIEVTFREKTEQDSEPKEKSGYGPILDWILSIIEWIKHWFQA